MLPHGLVHPGGIEFVSRKHPAVFDRDSGEESVDALRCAGRIRHLNHEFAMVGTIE
jgi:hypothetical protein